MPQVIKPKIGRVMQDIQTLARTFRSATVTFERAARTFPSAKLGQQVIETTVVYKGEVLVVPIGGNIQQMGLGEIENNQPQVLVTGKRDIRQGDFTTLDSIRYEVEFAQAMWQGGFMLIRLKQWSQ